MEAVQEFPEGFFFIRCKSQPFAIDVNGGSMIVCLFFKQNNKNRGNNLYDIRMTLLLLFGLRK